jgi:catechol 2,3-dioxygenase-like lactoylglutathione lyase family enzyme
VDTVDVQFIASVSVITPDPVASRQLYMEALGMPLERMDGEYFASERIEGAKHFGVWPLAQAAHACFGTTDWPTDRPVPQLSLEFELADADAVAQGAAELQAGGFRLLHGARTEPWGQTVARLQTLEGLIVGLSYAPWFH